MFKNFAIHKSLLFFRGYLNDTVFKNQYIMQKLNSTATQSKTECISQEKRKLTNCTVHLVKDYEHKGRPMECILFKKPFTQVSVRVSYYYSHYYGYINNVRSVR